MNEETSRLLSSAIKGAAKGGPVGAIVSVASGAAVIVTIPAWVPFVATGLAISTTAVATGMAIGTGAGAVLGTTTEYLKIRREEQELKNEFGLD